EGRRTGLLDPRLLSLEQIAPTFRLENGGDTEKTVGSFDVGVERRRGDGRRRCTRRLSRIDQQPEARAVDLLQERFQPRELLCELVELIVVEGHAGSTQRHDARVRVDVHLEVSPRMRLGHAMPKTILPKCFPSPREPSAFAASANGRSRSITGSILL